MDPKLPAGVQGWQAPPDRLPARADRIEPLLFDAVHHPIETPDAWAQRRRALSDAWRTFLGVIPRPADPPTPKVIEEDRDPGVIRQLVRYEAEPGLPIEGYLIRPEGRPPAGRWPGVVVFHSTDEATIRQPAGLSGPADKHLGLLLAKAGYVTFSPRCFLWQYGSPKKLTEAVDWLHRRHPGVLGMAKMLFDAVRAVDLLAADPAVDAGRLGAVGHSLGAKEVLYLEAFDERIKVGMFSEGGIGLGMSNWEAPWYLGDAIRRPGFPLNHAQLLALVAPRSFLLVGGESADGDASWPYIQATMPVWSLLGKPQGIGWLNHRGGHAVPPVTRDAMHAWLDAAIGPARV